VRRLAPPPSPAAERGIGIIELLVGLLIGMIGVVAIFQVINAGSASKRTLQGGVDAHASGSIALYRIERDLMHAGFGFARLPSAYYDCDVRGAKAGAGFAFPLLPVRVTQGTGGAPDSVEMLIGSSTVNTEAVAYSGGTSTSKSLASRAGFFAGNLIVAGPSLAAGQCALLQVSGNGADDYTITHTGGPVPAVALATTGHVVNLGSAPRYMIWTVADGALISRDALDPAVPALSMADGIVDLQAQYGYDDDAVGAAGYGTVEDDEWRDALPAGADPGRIIAIRLALVARSGQYEREAVTPDASAPRWNAAARTFTLRNVDGTADSGAGALGPNNWRNYRYRVYETTVALRNVLWGR
jgi:type IV pilus assembly protein PilW